MVAELASVADLWRDDLVSFLLGCSFSFEAAMADSGIPLRHQEAGSNVPMYITNIATRPAGMFSGPMVVSMRPIPQEQIVRAVQVTSRFPDTHGAPVHIGDPDAIGIRDINAPRVRRCRGNQAWRDPRLLGLRCDPTGRRPQLQAAADDHPRPPARCSSPTAATPTTQSSDHGAS